MKCPCGLRSIIRFNESRTQQEALRRPLALKVIHSHPPNMSMCLTVSNESSRVNIRVQQNQVQTLNCAELKNKYISQTSKYGSQELLWLITTDFNNDFIISVIQADKI